jgi:UDP-N-acetylmuramate--alanine ligase
MTDDMPRPAPVRLNPAWHYHFLGIGGVGMSALAELLHGRGVRVSGSDTAVGDTAQSPTLRRLESLGIPVAAGHPPSALEGVDAVVFTPAVSPTHPVWEEVRRRGLPRLHRAQMLGAVTEGLATLAVSGTHGKTTASACLGFALERAGWDPTVLVGGHVAQFGGQNVRAGAGGWCVAEADESDGSFVHLRPRGILLTNVEADHLDHHGSLENLTASFRAFLARLEPEGVLAWCADDPGAAALGRAHGSRTQPDQEQPGRTQPGRTQADRTQLGHAVSYGAAEDADVRVTVGQLRPGAMDMALHDGERRHALTTRLVGRHNAQNLAGVYALASRCGVPEAPLLAALAEFAGVERRQQFLGRFGPHGCAVFDDYAHHPTEIRATLEMFLAVYGRPLTVVFQPHLYSRTRQFAAGFAQALGAADRVYVTDVYAARERPEPGVTGALITGNMKEHPDARFAATWQELIPRLLGAEAPRGVLLTLGAGDVTGLGPALLQEGGRP